MDLYDLLPLHTLNHDVVTVLHKPKCDNGMSCYFFYSTIYFIRVNVNIAQLSIFERKCSICKMKCHPVKHMQGFSKCRLQ